MNYILVVLTLFAGGSVFGWFIELFFRRYLDPVERLKKKFSNPGFLVGPCLPIYGSGLILLFALAHIRIVLRYAIWGYERYYGYSRSAEERLFQDA